PIDADPSRRERNDLGYNRHSGGWQAARLPVSTFLMRPISSRCTPSPSEWILNLLTQPAWSWGNDPDCCSRTGGVLRSARDDDQLHGREPRANTDSRHGYSGLQPLRLHAGDL